MAGIDNLSGTPALSRVLAASTDKRSRETFAARLDEVQGTVATRATDTVGGFSADPAGGVDAARPRDDLARVDEDLPALSRYLVDSQLNLARLGRLEAGLKAVLAGDGDAEALGEVFADLQPLALPDGTDPAALARLRESGEALGGGADLRALLSDVRDLSDRTVDGVLDATGTLDDLRAHAGGAGEMPDDLKARYGGLLHAATLSASAAVQNDGTSARPGSVFNLQG